MNDESKIEVQERLVPLRHVAALLGISLRTVWRLISAGELPKPVHVGRQASLFASEVNAYLAKLKSSRNPQQGRS